MALRVERQQPRGRHESPESGLPAKRVDDPKVGCVPHEALALP